MVAVGLQPHVGKCHADGRAEDRDAAEKGGLARGASLRAKNDSHAQYPEGEREKLARIHALRPEEPAKRKCKDRCARQQDGHQA